jgi:hypothetical protein
VLVTGEPGVGKSRLREELVQWVRGRGEPAAIWIARGDAMRAAAPLGLLGDLVREAAHLHAGEPVAVRREKLRGRVAQNADAAQAARLAEFLGEIVGTHFLGDDRVELRAARQNPMLMADQMRRAWIDFLAAECRAQPVLLVLEDLHWSDQATVDYLDASLRLLKEEPLLVLALARPEVSALFSDLWRARGVSQIHLGGLSRNACARVSRRLLGEGATREVTDRLWERAARLLPSGSTRMRRPSRRGYWSSGRMKASCAPATPGEDLLIMSFILSCRGHWPCCNRRARRPRLLRRREAAKSRLRVGFRAPRAGSPGTGRTPVTRVIGAAARAPARRAGTRASGRVSDQDDGGNRRGEPRQSNSSSTTPHPAQRGRRAEDGGDGPAAGSGCGSRMEIHGSGVADAARG